MSIARASYMFICFWGVKEVQVLARSFLHDAFKTLNSSDYFGGDTNCIFLAKIGRSLLNVKVQRTLRRPSRTLNKLHTSSPGHIRSISSLSLSCTCVSVAR